LWLSVLLCLFVFRVLAQLLQARYPTSWIPAFAQWQGSSRPYPVLLCTQILIVLLVAIVIRRISAGTLIPNIRLGRVLLALGGLYFILMLLRMALGLTLLSSTPWFGAPLPAFFHLVLASIVLLIGHYHYQYRQGARSQ
jgi:hypothetical protein